MSFPNGIAPTASGIATNGIAPTARACVADGIATDGIAPTARACIADGIAPLIITLLISLLLIVCHFIYYNRNKFSLFNRAMSASIQTKDQAKQDQAKQAQVKAQVKAPVKPLKIVVFDLDETLGCFIEVGIFWDALEDYYGHSLFKEKFFEVLDIFPEFLRPNIFKILEFVKEKKEKLQCDHVMIYTNNQGPKSWVKMISEYFNSTLEYELFDKIIAAFKVKNKIIEICRTSHDKSVDDLIRCTKIPPNAEICFIDDQFHPLMEQDNVYYVHVKPYMFTMSFEKMAMRYFDKYLDKPDDKENIVKKLDFIDNMVTFMKKYNFLTRDKSDLEQNADKVVSKQLLIHLETFFKKGRMKNTRKQKSQLKSRTTRRRNMFI